MRKKTEAKIQLQDYEVLLENPYRLDFTIEQLNQVSVCFFLSPSSSCLRVWLPGKNKKNTGK